MSASPMGLFEIQFIYFVFSSLLTITLDCINNKYFYIRKVLVIIIKLARFLDIMV